MKANFRKQVFSLMECNMKLSAEMIVILAFVHKVSMKAKTLAGRRINKVNNFNCLNCGVCCLGNKI